MKPLMNLKQAKQLVDKYAKSLDLNAFIVNKQPRIISVYHFDGSYLEFHSASFKKLDDEWMAVFTEHFEDVRWIKAWEHNKLKELYQYKDKETK